MCESVLRLTHVFVMRHNELIKNIGYVLLFILVNFLNILTICIHVLEFNK